MSNRKECLHSVWMQYSTECGRMDSHISKGNKKRTKQVTEKSFIFSKSTYNLVISH